MKITQIIKKIVEHLEAFEKENHNNHDFDIADFVGYLNTKFNPTPESSRELGGDFEPVIKQMGNDTDTDIARLVSLMNRYSKGYIKKALKDSLIQTSEEFTFLIILLSHGSLSKTELITKNVVEKTSGTEVIKRLLNQQLLTQFDDEHDKRSQRVTVTDKGRAEVMQLLPKMQLVGNVVVGNLTTTEKQTLLYLLKKLDYHHNDIFMNHKEDDLANLVAKN
jgi:DNA-binding MarR family transcriptional regulator